MERWDARRALPHKCVIRHFGEEAVSWRGERSVQTGYLKCNTVQRWDLKTEIMMWFEDDLERCFVAIDNGNDIAALNSFLWKTQMVEKTILNY